MKKDVLCLKSAIRTLFLLSLFFISIYVFNLKSYASVEDSNGFVYADTYNDGTYTVTDYKGTSTCITIPESYNGVNITRIGDGFLYQKDMSTKVTSVSIPYSIINIGKNAFRECTSLTSVTFYTTSSSHVFFGSGLTSTSLNVIQDYAFYGDTALTSFDFSPEGLSTIGAFAFANCTSMTYLVLPSTITSIGAGAFYNWTNLSELKFNGEADKWVSITYGTSSDSQYDCGAHPNYYADNTYFATTTTNYYQVTYNYYKPTSFTATVTSIPSFLFYGFTGLTTVDLTGVTSVGTGAFENCSALNSLTLTDSLTYLGDSAFAGCTALTEASLSPNLTYLGKEAFSGDTLLKTIYVGNGVSEIKDHTFYNCSTLNKITVCNNVTSIADNAFEGCSSLTTVSVMSYSVAETYFTNYNSGILIKYLDGSTVEKYTDSTLTGYSVSYDGTIGVKFYFTFSSSVTSDSGAKVRLYLPTVSGNYTTEDIYLKDVTASNGEYIFTASIAPKFASDKVGAQVILSNGTTGTKYEISFVDYAKYVLSDSSTDSKIATYIQALLTYCDAVEKYFDYNAGTIPSGMLLSLSTPSGNASTISDDGYIGSSIVLDSDVSLKLYFYGNRDNITFSFSNVTNLSYDNVVSRVYISDADITVYTISGFVFGQSRWSSDFLGAKKYITVKSGGTSIGGFYLLSYLTSAVNSNDDKLVYLAKAMYTLEYTSVPTSETTVR